MDFDEPVILLSACRINLFTNLVEFKIFITFAALNKYVIKDNLILTRGVMVTHLVLVQAFKVRVLTGQQKISFNERDFFVFDESVILCGFLFQG